MALVGLSILSAGLLRWSHQGSKDSSIGMDGMVHKLGAIPRTRTPALVERHRHYRPLPIPETRRDADPPLMLR